MLEIVITMAEKSGQVFLFMPAFSNDKFTFLILVGPHWRAVNDIISHTSSHRCHTHTHTGGILAGQHKKRAQAGEQEEHLYILQPYVLLFHLQVICQGGYTRGELICYLQKFSTPCCFYHSIATWRQPWHMGCTEHTNPPVVHQLLWNL